MKKTIILTTLLLCSTIYSIGQGGKVSIGLVGSGEINNYYFNDDTFNSLYHFESNMGSTVGIVLNYRLIDKVYLKSGLSFNLQKYAAYYRFYTPTPIPIIDPALPHRTELNISQLKVPVMVGYELLNKGKFRFTPFAGIKIGFQFNEKETTIYQDGRKEKSEILNTNLNQTQIIVSLDLRIEYHIGEKTFIGLTPFIGKGLTKIDDEIMDSGQFSYGVFLGLYFKL